MRLGCMTKDERGNRAGRSDLRKLEGGMLRRRTDWGVREWGAKNEYGREVMFIASTLAIDGTKMLCATSNGYSARAQSPSVVKL